MSKSWRDRPVKERENVVKKAERGDHRKMEPYKRIHNKKSWDNQE
jgi:hypothetical protein